MDTKTKSDAILACTRFLLRRRSRRRSRAATDRHASPLRWLRMTASVRAKHGASKYCRKVIGFGFHSWSFLCKRVDHVATLMNSHLKRLHRGLVEDNDWIPRDQLDIVLDPRTQAKHSYSFERALPSELREQCPPASGRSR